MDPAHDVGINFFDSANVYGRSKGRGATEEIVGRWFAQGGGRRERTVLATKLYGDMGDWPNEGRLSALNIRRALRRLAAPPADRLHRPLPDAPHRPRHAVGRDLGGHGGAAAAGQDALRRVVQLRRLAHREGPGGRAARATSSAWSASSRIYNLMARQIELEVLPAARHYGHRRHPVVAAAGRPARRRHRKEQRGQPPAPGTAAARRSSAAARSSSSTRTSATRLGEEPATVGAGLAADPARVTGADRRAADVDQLDAALRRARGHARRRGAGAARRHLPRAPAAPEDYAW